MERQTSPVRPEGQSGASSVEGQQRRRYAAVASRQPSDRAPATGADDEVDSGPGPELDVAVHVMCVVPESSVQMYVVDFPTSPVYANVRLLDGGPAWPVAPVSPFGPCGPAGPAGPGDPAAPGAPEAPAGPGLPATPVGPWDDCDHMGRCKVAVAERRALTAPDHEGGPALSGSHRASVGGHGEYAVKFSAA